MRRRAPEFDETAVGRAIIGLIGVLVIGGLYHVAEWLFGR